MVSLVSKKFIQKLPNLVDVAKISFSTLTKFVAKEIRTIEHGPFDNFMQQSIQVVGPKIFAPPAVQGDYLEDFQKLLVYKQETNYGSTVTGQITLGGVTKEYEVVPDEAG